MLLHKLIGFLPSPYKSQQKNSSIVYNDRVQIAHSPDNDSRISHANSSLSLGQHWTVAGATGAGKTVFCLELLEQFRRKFPHIPRYVLNSTGDIQFDNIIGAKHFIGNSIPPITNDTAYTTIWTPDDDVMENYDSWLLSFLYSRKPAIVLLDDIASLIGYGNTVHPLRGHILLLKQGRKHGITVINGTQEMTRVPLSMFRQMTHFIQLRLGNDPIDLSIARRYLDITKEEQHAPHSDYGLFHKRVGVNFPYEEYESYTQFFHRSK